MVVSVNRGHRELVRDGLNGYCLDPEDVTGFSEKIMELLMDPEKMYRMGENGYASVQSFTAQAVRGELEAIYRNCGIL